jgi:hypothetical protein
MPTIDCFRSGSICELTVICTGMTAAPVAIDLETGASVTMQPAWANTELARFGIASVSRAPHGFTGDAWWGGLPIGKDRTEARLALVIDGVEQHVTARWPEPEPEPKPKRKRRKSNVVAIVSPASKRAPRCRQAAAMNVPG